MSLKETAMAARRSLRMIAAVHATAKNIDPHAEFVRINAMSDQTAVRQLARIDEERREEQKLRKDFFDPQT